MRKLSWKVMLLVLMLSCSSACRTKVIVLEKGKEVSRVPRNKPFTSTVDGWFVPDIRMIEILNKLSGDRVKREHE